MIEAIKRRLEAAHKGPWRAVRAGSKVITNFSLSPDKQWVSYAEDDCIIGPDGEEVLGSSEWIRVEWDDLEFMAHARQDVFDLLTEVERLRTENIELLETLYAVIAETPWHCIEPTALDAARAVIAKAEGGEA